MKKQRQQSFPRRKRILTGLHLTFPKTRKQWDSPVSPRAVRPTSLPELWRLRREGEQGQLAPQKGRRRGQEASATQMGSDGPSWDGTPCTEAQTLLGKQAELVTGKKLVPWTSAAPTFSPCFQASRSRDA